MTLIVDRDYISQIYHVAKAYTTSGEVSWIPIVHLIRDKSRAYYDGILADDGIMKPYVKDLGGHKENPINGKLDGLFFMALNDSIKKSMFGDTRYTVSAMELLNGNNLYLSDFYCMKSRNHYIQIVVCKPGSNADDRCNVEFRLKKLDKNNTDFIRFSMDGTRVECRSKTKKNYNDQLVHKRVLYLEFMYT